MPTLSSRFSTALVTGASGGLGHAFAEMLLKEGVAVWGTARDTARLSGLKTYEKFSPLALDLADSESIDEVLADAAARAGGGFDLMINNAGFGIFGRFDQLPFSQWRAQLDAALIGSLQVAHFGVRALFARNHGCLVNVSSIAVDQPLPFMSGYNMAKAGLSALSESLIFETRSRPITIIDFRPGDYRTQFNQAMQSTSASVSSQSDSRLAPVWRVLESNLAGGPLPTRAARDLRAALWKGRSGVVYSGSFFQAVLAPLFSRLAPARLRRAIAARYFGVV